MQRGSGYGWFTEGFDTLDLKEAKALLDEYGPEPALRPSSSMVAGKLDVLGDRLESTNDRERS